jgi:hypothetical protein
MRLIARVATTPIASAGDVIAHTSTAKGYFGLLKCGVVGTSHHVSEQHLDRYLAEFAFRYNARHVTDSDTNGKGTQPSSREKACLQGLVADGSGACTVPIDPKKITSDVTLELDEQAVSVTAFAKALDHFIGLVKEVSISAAPTKDPSAWLVDVYPGSVGIGLRAQSGAFSYEEISVIRSALLAGVRDLDAGHRPRMFSDRAIEHSKALATIQNKRAQPLTVRIWSGQSEAIPVSREIVRSAETLLAPSYEQEGTVDGRLERVSAHDKYEFVIYDTVTDRGITCYVDEPLLDQALLAFRKRVEVTGTIKYRSDGQPVSVRAREIVRFPDASEIPSLDQIRDLLKGA